MDIIMGVAIVGALAFIVWRVATGGASVRTTFLLSQAAVVIQNLLELHGKIAEPAADPARLANRLVARVAQDSPNLVAGNLGRRPHKLTLAAITLAAGLQEAEYAQNEKTLLFLSLGTILLELTGKPHLFALTQVDHNLIATAQSVYLSYDQAR